ncbi:hypothetical protein JW766_02535 [Candidatus Dojkabacteria bacterium]|nr:hypothetical protein [Candidatus Dojkabacteria bacterium]
MKDKIVLIILVFIAISIGIGIFFFFTRESGTDKTTGPSTRTDEELESLWESDGSVSNCPEGLVCLSSQGVPSLPVVRLGANDVYAAEPEGEVEEEMPSVEEKPEEQATETIKENTPQKVQITNEDFRIWSIAWVTDTAQTGYIQFGTDETELVRTEYDDREENTNNLEKRFTHHVTIINSDEDLDIEGLTYYFTIVSNDEEFNDNGKPYSYASAQLTSSPSTPASVSITSNKVAGFSDVDYLVLAKQIDIHGEESSIVSGIYNATGGVELVIGIAREQDLVSYFPYSSENGLQVKLYGPDSYTGYVSAVALDELEDKILNIRAEKTGYNDEIFASTAGSNFTIESEVTATTSQDPAPEAEQQTTQNTGTDLPSTGFEDYWLFRTMFGLIVFTAGAGWIIVFINSNCKKWWEEKVVKDVEDW